MTTANFTAEGISTFSTQASGMLRAVTCVPKFPAAATKGGRLHLIVLTRSACSRNQIAPAYRNWCPSAMGACPSPPLRSYAARRG